MGNIIKDQKIVQRVIVGRKCDICGYEEISNRSAIRFDHGSDTRWAKTQLCLKDYTDANNNRWYYTCSLKCIISLMKDKLSWANKEGDCLAGIPMAYLKAIVAAMEGRAV